MTHGEWLGGWGGFDCLGRAKSLTVKVRRMKIYIHKKMWTCLRKKYRKVGDIVDIAQGTVLTYHI